MLFSDTPGARVTVISIALIFTAAGSVPMVESLNNGAVLVNVVLPDILPDVAVIIEVPTATPVARPLAVVMLAGAAGHTSEPIAFPSLRHSYRSKAVLEGVQWQDVQSRG